MLREIDLISFRDEGTSAPIRGTDFTLCGDTNTLLAIFSALERSSLDALSLVSRGFHKLIRDHMQDRCLRFLPEVSVCCDASHRAVNASDNKRKFHATFCEGPGHQAMVLESRDSLANAMALMTPALRSSYVQKFEIDRHFMFSWFRERLPEFADTVHVGRLVFLGLRHVSPEAFHETVFSLSSVENLQVDGDALAEHFSDAFLRACIDKHICTLHLLTTRLLKSNRYLVSDDGILDFCFGGVEDTSLFLAVSNVCTSRDFVKKAIEHYYSYPSSADFELLLEGIDGGAAMDTSGLTPAATAMGVKYAFEAEHAGGKRMEIRLGLTCVHVAKGEPGSQVFVEMEQSRMRMAFLMARHLQYLPALPDDDSDLQS